MKMNFSTTTVEGCKKQMRCLLIGSSSSIADSLKSIFSENGYEVFLASRNISSESFLEINFSISTSGELVVEKQKTLENMDVVIFCIGKIYGKSIVDYSDEDVQEAFDANVIIVSKFMKFLMPNLNNNATVVFISSIAASAGSFDEIYSASKSALYGLTKSLAKNSKRGIRFNCVSPGLIESTSMHQAFSDKVVDKHLEQTPINKLITTSDLALILFDICQPLYFAICFVLLFNKRRWNATIKETSSIPALKTNPHPLVRNKISRIEFFFTALAFHFFTSFSIEA